MKPETVQAPFAEIAEELARELRASADLLSAEDEEALRVLLRDRRGEDLLVALAPAHADLFRVASRVRGLAKSCGASKVLRKPLGALPAVYAELVLDELDVPDVL